VLPENDLREQPLSLVRLLPVFIVYVVWGSTYLAIRLVVREGSGFPPFAAAAYRFLTAGALILLWGRLTGKRMRLQREEWLTLALSGILMLTAGNGLVSWAEQQADSGLAALLVGATPIWTILIESVLDRKMPSLRLVGAVLLGFGGIAVLVLPGIKTGSEAHFWAIMALLIAGFTWALGSIRQARKPVGLDPIISSGYQMLFGGVGLLISSALLGEPRPMPTTEAWLAWAFLVVFGSLLAYTAYITALKTLPIQIVMTYSYVNPVIAVFLGWLVLSESITVWMIAGTTLVLLGVVGVFRERSLRRATSR
jgi:drug/metabolite transporter (DMT)-like permease